MTQHTLIKTVLNYCLLATARTRQHDGDEKAWIPGRYILALYFLGKKGSHQHVCKTCCISLSLFILQWKENRLMWKMLR